MGNCFGHKTKIGEITVEEGGVVQLTGGTGITIGRVVHTRSQCQTERRQQIHHRHIQN